MALISMALSDLWPTFQGHDEQRQITGLIVSRVWSTQWFCFQLPRLTLNLDFKVKGVIIDAFDVLSAQLMQDLFA